MGVKPLHPFLILLVLLVPLDDIWAFSTPDPSDDVAAAENNDFQPTVRRSQQDRPDIKNLPGPGPAAHQPAPVTATAALRVWTGEPRPQAPVGASLLYALMSLQR
jgi:hypothetical protein